MLTPACKHCSGPIPPSAGPRGPKRKYCSQKCALAFWRAAHPDYHQLRYVPRPHKKYEYSLKAKLCIGCGIDFLGQALRKRCDTCQSIKKAPLPRRFLNCALCEKPISKKVHPNVKFCAKCRAIPHRAYRRSAKYAINDNEKARRLTKYAVKLGLLPNPLDFKCVDCKRRQAECYDHRDYSKPLNVDPVCCRCNSSRGKGVAVHFPCAEYVASDEGKRVA